MMEVLMPEISVGASEKGPEGQMPDLVANSISKEIPSVKTLSDGLIEPFIEKEGLKDEIVKELKTIGVCDLCVLRYLGVKDPYLYRADHHIRKILYDEVKGPPKLEPELSKLSPESETTLEDEGPSAKIPKANPCIACLGLLQDCILEPCLNQIADRIKEDGIEATSYGPMLTLPIAVSIRAYSIWYHLVQKFPKAYKPMSYLKPEGVTLKSVWKWICTGDLKQKVDSRAEWMTNGDLVVNIFLKYQDEDFDCLPLWGIVKKENNKNRRNANTELTRGAADSALLSLDVETFRETFTSPPTIPNSSLVLEKIACSHMAMFVAGRYCKYSRDVSQSPWLNTDGTRRRGLGSVQELISDQVTPLFNCDQMKFCASGREDSDVRMLGKGRPFALEIINPKKTLFTVKRIQELKQKINESTELISVRDLQIVDKKDLATLKDGEESKQKRYTALCKTPGREVTGEMLKLLNEMPVPIVLQQQTPLRVLHRRSLATRPRSIIEMSAEPAKNSKEMFILHVKTEAGTYVKEFVHGDFGRTQPSITSIFNCVTEILALDVNGVELDWPPVIDE